MRFSLLAFAASITLPLVSAATAPPGDALLQTIYQFPNLTWVENIAVRSNGLVLVSLINTPEVWQIDPANKSAELIYHFPDAVSAMGFAEVFPDVFVVTVGNFSDQTFKSTPGSWSAWKLDFNGKHEGSHWGRDWSWSGKSGPKVKKITDIPETIFLNGNTAISTDPGVALIGDAGQGVIYRLDSTTGKYSIAIDDPELKPNPSAFVQLGVNGVHFQDGYVYFVNTFNTPFYNRVPVNTQGIQSGPVEVIASTPQYPTRGGAAADDFTLDKYGNAWVASASDTLVKITPQNNQTIIAGGVTSPVLRGCTSAAFGRTRKTKSVLYVTTDGGLSDPTLGIEGGKVVMLDVAGL